MRRTGALLLLAVVAAAAALGSSAAQPGGAKDFTLVVLHLNDTYEITPLNRGTAGGMARVATLRKQLAEKYGGRLLTVHAGDFVSPSAIGTAVVDGRPLAGRQMVDVLKAVGVDYIIFGNHEFDPNEDTFTDRLRELVDLRSLPADGPPLDPKLVADANDRRRALFSTNVLGKDGKPIPGVPKTRVWEPRDEHGTPLARVGFLGLTLETLKSDPAKQYVRFVKPLDAARDQLAAWAAGEKLDAVVALTHQALASDEELARADLPLPIDLILGGHEHVNAARRPLPAKAGGRAPPPIFRADANARTVYVHRLEFADGRLARIESTLTAVTDVTPEDPAVAGVVRGWVEKAYRAFRADGRGDPDEELGTLPDTYDGREESVRRHRTNLTDLIGDAMLAPVKGVPADAKLAMFNGGSVRIDDELQAGPVTTYDVLRVLPFGGTVHAVDVPGDVLGAMLDYTASGPDGRDPGWDTGAFIQLRNAARKDGRWLVGGKELGQDPKTTYTVVSNDYLIRGDQRLESTNAVVFGEPLAALAKASGLTPEAWRKALATPGGPAAAGLKSVRPLGDWRDLLRDHLRGMKPGRAVGAGAVGGPAAQEVVVKVVGPETAPAPPDAGRGGAGGDKPAGVTVGGGDKPIQVAVEVKGGKEDGTKTDPHKCQWCFEPWHVLLALAVALLLAVPPTLCLRWLLETRRQESQYRSSRDWEEAHRRGERIAHQERVRAWELLLQIEDGLGGRPQQDSKPWVDLTSKSSPSSADLSAAWNLVRSAPRSDPPSPGADMRVAEARSRLTQLYTLLTARSRWLPNELETRFIQAAAVLDKALRG